MNHTLIVPMNVEALCVTNPQDPFVGPSADFSRFPAMAADGRLVGGADYLADTIQRYPAATCGVGIRLHWMLPTSLRRGRHDPGTDRVVFPRVPNRWLITRLLTMDDGGSPRLKSWVLESDRIDRRGPSRPPFSATMPYLDQAKDGQFYRYLGYWHDYDNWSENRSGLGFEEVTGQPFTAVGYGDPLYASFAPNCPNVFAFDDLFGHTLVDPAEEGADAARAQALGREYQLSYTVSGWFAEVAQDPVHMALRAGGLSGKGNPWRWAFDGPVPKRMMTSGTVSGLVWSLSRGPASEADGRLLPSAPDIAIGNSAAEAVSAMIAADMGDAGGEDAEFLLDAVQAGVLDKLHGQPGWISEVEAELHRKSFVAHHGGWIWKVIDAREPHNDATRAMDNRPEAPLAPEAAHALSALNMLQQDYDRAAFHLSSAGQQLYLDWYRRQLLVGARPTSPRQPWREAAPGLDTSAIDNLIRAEIERLWKRRREAGELSYQQDEEGNDEPVSRVADKSLAASVRGAWQALADALVSRVERSASAARKGLPAPAGIVSSQPAEIGSSQPPFRIKRVPGPRFWSPADPVILMRGTAVEPPRRGGSTSDLDDRGDLRCRLAQDIVAMAGPGALTSDELAGALGFPSLEFERLERDIGEAAGALVAEAVLLDGRFESVIRTRADLPPGTPHLQQAALSRGPESAPGEVADGPVRGTPAPAFARSAGARNQWSPLLLNWTLQYHGTTDGGVDGANVDYRSDALTDGHIFDEGRIDLHFKESTAIPGDGDWHNYSGWAPLSSHATIDLAGALENAATYDPDPELADIKAKLSSAAIMAQAAGGFHDALLMREKVMQLKPVDLLNPGYSLAGDIGKLTERVTGLAPDDRNPYSALRSGFVRLADIQIVDTFGRAVRFDGPAATWSRSLRDPSGRAALPARLAQPSRLQFRWLAADSEEIEATDHPAASPICGWILPNNLNGSLDFYAPSGDALGSLKPAGASGEAAWHGAPEDGREIEHFAGDLSAQADAIARDLKGFGELCRLATALQSRRGYLDAMLRAIDAEQATITPAEAGNATAYLFGRPLALVRASLSIEFQGPTAPDQGWQALRSDAEAATIAGDAWTGNREDHALGAVKFPVHLGDTRLANDGLIGAFAAGDEHYARFFSPSAKEEKSGVAPAEPLHLAANEKALTVAMLVDARAPVHATTGVLPVKQIAIPPGAYQPALARLEVGFYAGPLLLPAKKTPLPLPGFPGFTWEWHHPVEGHWKVTAPDPPLGDRAQRQYDTQRLEEGWVMMRQTGSAS